MGGHWSVGRSIYEVVNNCRGGIGGNSRLVHPGCPAVCLGCNAVRGQKKSPAVQAGLIHRGIPIYVINSPGGSSCTKRVFEFPSRNHLSSAYLTGIISTLVTCRPCPSSSPTRIFTIPPSVSICSSLSRAVLKWCILFIIIPLSFIFSGVIPRNGPHTPFQGGRLGPAR